ncbi:hypothetical protein BD626DRAFT_501121 [Schizophyllum amplum]|uniref:Ino eighty subunit 1 n=1 Tax=Schizophyllum amplum TaxID=97359 RepID=A0A550C9J2_9AGAR|nr:hypothetical protein BD626DRAFT_501121 [Auriculariopsis ampla]
MSRRAPRGIALKHTDGQPLTRQDIQYELLAAIFADENRAFTDPASGAKMSFRDVYVSAIRNSPKASPALKNKMAQSQDYATDFGMLALLTNVGRLSATMGFFPEMKTAVRTYHPVPALQRTGDHNMLDMPRIKTIIRGALLETERNGIPSTLAEILIHARAGHVPSTSMTNLIFVLSQSFAQVSDFFPPEFEFLDIFVPSEYTPQSRARAFLWICCFLLETPLESDSDYQGPRNPFSEPTRPGKAPPLVKMTPEEASRIDHDSEREKALANTLISTRNRFLHNLMEKNKGVINFAGPSSQTPTYQEDDPGDQPTASTSAGKRKASGGAASEKEAKTRRVEGRLRADTVTLPPSAGPSTARRRSPSRPQSPGIRLVPPRSIMDLIHHSPPPSLLPRIPEPTEPTRARSFSLPPGLPHSPTPHPNLDVSIHDYNTRARSPLADAPIIAPEPTAFQPPDGPMLRYAWNDIHTRDCLRDSDDSLDNDEAQREYIQRLDVVTRLPFLEPSAQPQWEPDPPMRPSPRYLFSSRPHEHS